MSKKPREEEDGKDCGATAVVTSTAVTATAKASPFDRLEPSLWWEIFDYFDVHVKNTWPHTRRQKVKYHYACPMTRVSKTWHTMVTTWKNQYAKSVVWTPPYIFETFDDSQANEPWFDRTSCAKPFIPFFSDLSTCELVSVQTLRIRSICDKQYHKDDGCSDRVIVEGVEKALRTQTLNIRPDMLSLYVPKDCIYRDSESDDDDERETKALENKANDDTLMDYDTGEVIELVEDKDEDETTVEPSFLGSIRHIRFDSPCLSYFQHPRLSYTAGTMFTLFRAAIRHLGVERLSFSHPHCMTTGMSIHPCEDLKKDMTATTTTATNCLMVNGRSMITCRRCLKWTFGREPCHPNCLYTDPMLCVTCAMSGVYVCNAAGTNVNNQSYTNCGMAFSSNIDPTILSSYRLWTHTKCGRQTYAYDDQLGGTLIVMTCWYCETDREFK